jgi:sulfate transport system permease protein
VEFVPAAPRWRLREPNVLPGFKLALGFTLLYLSLILLIPWRR